MADPQKSPFDDFETVGESRDDRANKTWSARDWFWLTSGAAIAGAHGSVVRAASDDGRYLLCQRVVSTFSYVIDTQTNNRQFLYQARAHSMAVDISNNGRYVVLLEKIVPGDYRWTLYDMNTGRLVPLPNAKRSTTRAAASATVSDDGNTVAYTMYDHNVIKLVVYVYDRTTDSHIFRAGSNALISTRRPQLPPSLRMSGDGNEISYVTRSGNLLLRDLTKVNGIRYKPAGGKVVMTADSFTPQSPWLLTLNRVGAYDGNGNFDGFLTLFDRRSGQEKVLPNLATAVIEGNDYAKLELSADGRIIVGAGWRVASSQQPELDAIKIYDVETGMFYPVEVSRGVPALCDFGSRVLVRP